MIATWIATTGWVILWLGAMALGAFLWNITMFEERCEEARQDGITMGMKL